jgi:hypothetical protein
MSDRPNLADQLPEPPDTTLLVLKIGEEYQVVQRRDATAHELSEHDDDRWFDMGDMDSDGLAWREALKYATKVCACVVLASL